MPPRPSKKPGAHDRTTTASHPQQQTPLQGLVPPSKRIPKQRSNGDILDKSRSASHPNGSSTPPSSSALPPSAHQQLLDEEQTSATTTGYTSFPRDDNHFNASPDGQEEMGDHIARARREANAPSSTVAQTADGVQTADQYLPSRTSSPRRIDLASAPSTNSINASGFPRQQRVRDNWGLAKTILTACPLWDVIALLIVLLQLPPTIVSIIHVLFAGLTFVTPATTVTNLSNLPTMQEILLGSGGAPSLPTIVILDIVVFVIFCALNFSLQNVLLDFAQAVIAVSLGGAVASRGGSTQIVTCCLALITISHVFRWKPARQAGLNLLWSGMSKTGFRSEGDLPPTLPDLSINAYQSPGWVRTILGVHILTQGVVRMVRRHLLWKEHEPPLIARMRRSPSDPDSSPGPQSGPSFASGDANPDIAYSTSTDGRHPGPSPAPRNNNERLNNSRRRRRRATQVRSQQPFWAALASTKVTFVKEIEQNQSSNDATDVFSSNLSNVSPADFQSLKDRVWIKGISSSEIAFGLCAVQISEVRDDDAERSNSDTTIPVSRRPFYVRLNGASWSSLKNDGVHMANHNEREELHVWEGRISGLTAYSPYQVEFVRREDDAVIYTASLVTQPAPSTEQVPVPPPPTQTLRPSSPITTLKNSIQAAENELELAKNALKKKRKDHRTATSSAQKEIDGQSARLSSTGHNDARHKARIQQLEQTIRRLEEEADDLEVQTEDMGEIPETDIRQSTDKKQQLNKIKETHRTSQRAVEASRGEMDAELEKAQAENSNLQKTQLKLAQRQTKNKTKYESLLAAKQQGAEAQQRRAAERKAFLSQRAMDEQRMRSHIEMTENQRNDMQNRIAGLMSQHNHLESLYRSAISVQQQAQLGAQSSHPGTPDGGLPGGGDASNRNSFPFAHSPFTNFQFPVPQVGMDQPSATSAPGSQRISNPLPVFSETYNHVPTASGQVMPTTTRHRSSSMLSAVSGFTDEHVTDSSAYTSNNGTTAFPPLTYNTTHNGFPTLLSYTPVNANGYGSNGTNAAAPTFYPGSQPISAVANSTSFSALRARRKSSLGSANGRGARSLSSSSGSGSGSSSRGEVANTSSGLSPVGEKGVLSDSSVSNIGSPAFAGVIGQKPGGKVNGTSPPRGLQSPISLSGKQG